MVGVALLAAGWTGQARAQETPKHKVISRAVTFQTEDGLTIYGTLHMPVAPPRTPVAGVVLFAEPGWIVRSTFDGRLGRDVAELEGMAALTVDVRGTAQSGRTRYEVFSRRQREQIQLDVRAAIAFLTSQKGVDPGRIGVVGTGIAADFALREAAETPSVQAAVLISGILSDASREFIADRHDVPILCLAGRDDKAGVREMANAFALSESRDSHIILTASGHGTGMFTRNKGLAEEVASWLGRNVKGVGVGSEISFTTPDGWTLRGSLQIPDDLKPGAKVPGVVLVHGANHDQYTWYALSRALTKEGLATLVFDWRGKNRDIAEGKGHHGIDMPPGSRDQVHVDVQSAVNFLAAQPAVDASRMALVAATAPTTETLKAAAGDARIRTIVMLSQYQLNDAARAYLTTSDTPLFLIASIEDLNYEVGSLAEFTKEAARLSKSKETNLLLYDNAGRGSEMLKTKPELEGMIVRWLRDKLAATGRGTAEQ
jgi:dienelactone hydrolase